MNFKVTVFLIEDFRVGEPEAIDRLLHIPDHEEISALPGYGTENGILHEADILIFIDHNFRIPCGDVPGNFRRLFVFPDQQTGCFMLQITVIQAGNLSFFCDELFFKVQRQLKKRFHGRGSLPHFRFERFRIRIKQPPDFLHSFSAVFSALLDFIFQF